MPMEISGSCGCRTSYMEQLKAEREKTEKAEKGGNDNGTSAQIPVPKDEYISSEKSAVKPSGLYRVGQDEAGNKKIFFDKPEKSSEEDENKQPGMKPANSGKPSEKCTADTDKVEREIRKLKEKRQQLMQQIKAAKDDETARKLEKELAQVENELSQKDNDAYRRQNTVFS